VEIKTVIIIAATAVITLNIIAFIAMIFARLELDKASSAIASVRASRASRLAEEASSRIDCCSASQMFFKNVTKRKRFWITHFFIIRSLNSLCLLV
jgi:hypothetical protein